MTKIELLAKKYIPDVNLETSVKGQVYKKLMTGIIAQNHLKVQESIAFKEKTNWFNSLTNLFRGKKAFNIPDVKDVIGSKDIYIRKGAESGKLINQTLRDTLSKDLKESILNFKSDTGLNPFVSRKGRLTTELNVINPKLIEMYKEKTKKTFEGYTTKGYAQPTNLQTIATTEIRSAVNDIKNTYMKKVVEKNKDIEVVKTWIHNKSFSKVPRLGHLKMNNVSVPMNENFLVSSYKKTKKGWVYTNMESMQHPHDPNASAENVINCNCDIKYNVYKKEY